MAFDQALLNPGGENAKGGPFYSVYVTVEAAATVEGANFFDAAADFLNNSAGQGVLLVIDTNAPTTIEYGYQSTATAVTLDVANKNTLD